jgi:Xaa-Pro aminopeptidase
MAGENAAAPSNSPGPTGGRGMGAFCSQGPGNQAIKPHTPVLVDYAANCAGYISDQTRIFSIGELSGRIRRHHDFMLEIQGALIRRAKPGVRAEDLYNLALERVNEAGLAGGFMGYPEPVPFVGHGVGLEMDEWPIIGCNQETVLEEGMVIALEPKLVFQGEGTVGIENTFVVKAEGLRKLNKFPDRIVSL